MSEMSAEPPARPGPRPGGRGPFHIECRPATHTNRASNTPQRSGRSVNETTPILRRPRELGSEGIGAGLDNARGARRESARPPSDRPRPLAVLVHLLPARRMRPGAPPRWARRHRGLIPFRRRRVSHLHPAQPRRRRGFERQRLAALEHIRLRRELVRAAAARYGIAEEAIAGAVLWDALENPYKRPLMRLGPGKVRPSRLGGPSAAELAERAGLVPFSPATALARWRLLQRPDSAIIYISAILASHAADYREIAGVEISDDPAVLCTLYQGGDSAERARRLADRRLRNPGAMPRAADEMGPWVAEHIDFVRAALRAGPSFQSGPFNVPISRAFPMPEAGLEPATRGL